MPIRPAPRTVLLIAALLVPTLGGCAVVGAANTAVGVTGAVVGATAKTAGAVVGVAADGVGAAGRAVTGGGAKSPKSN